MTIRGDLEVIISRDKPPEERVADIFSWLTSADVIVFLENDGQNVAFYLDAIDLLEQKCVGSPS